MIRNKFCPAVCISKRLCGSPGPTWIFSGTTLTHLGARGPEPWVDQTHRGIDNGGESPSGCPTWQIKEREGWEGSGLLIRPMLRFLLGSHPRSSVVTGFPCRLIWETCPALQSRLSCSLLWLRQQFSRVWQRSQHLPPVLGVWWPAQSKCYRCVFIYSTRLCHSKLQSHQCLCFIHKTNSQCHYLTRIQSPQILFSPHSLSSTSAPYNLRRLVFSGIPKPDTHSCLLLPCIPQRPVLCFLIKSILPSKYPLLLTFLICRDQWASIVLITDSSFTISHTVFGFTLWAYRQSSFTCILLANAEHTQLKKRGRVTTRPPMHGSRMWPVLCILPTFLSTVPWGNIPMIPARWKLSSDVISKTPPLPRHAITYPVWCSLQHIYQQDRQTYFFVIFLPPTKT